MFTRGFQFATFSELAFRFALSPAIALESLAFALLVGFLEGFLPAVRAARRNILQSLRTASFNKGEARPRP